MRSWDDYKKTMATEMTLWQAAKENDLKQITALVVQGAKINAKDHRGYSPLMLAVYSGQMEATRLLLSMGADPNSFDCGGNSVLMGASFKGQIEIVEILVESGADPQMTNASGMRAIDFAVTFGRREVEKFLEQKGGSSSQRSRLGGFIKIILSRFQRVSATPNRSA